MELTSLQKKSVEEILEYYNPEQKIVCEFKAPTGSGKTLMASYFISLMIERNINDKFIFIIATPSSSSLPFFFEQKINKYKIDLPYSNFEVEYIQSPSNTKNDKTESISKILPEQNKVYIFGKSSFGKGRILSEYGIIDDFIVSAIDRDYTLVYIRDEAHIGGEKLDNSENAKNFENLMINSASFVLKMTATPDRTADTKKVILKETTLNNPLLNDGKFLLKTTPVLLLDHNLNDEKILEDAIKHFKNIKEQYDELKIGINPAMLIQIDNNSPSDNEKAKLFEKELILIKKTLDANNISWVQYFGNNDKDSNRIYKNDFSLDDITQNNNDIDAVIFKIGPSTGWDIPRACMLVQLRNVSSQSLNIQTLGRIKRNPYPNLEKNEITDKYYIYSNKTENEDIKEFNYKVREKFSNESFLAIDIANKKDIKSSSSILKFQKSFKEWLDKNQNSLISDINSSFINNGNDYKKIKYVENGHQIYSIINNPFIFLRDYKRLILSNKFIYELIKDSTEEFSQNNHIQKEFIVTLLLTNYKKNINDIISKTKNCKPKYRIIEQKYDPTVYSEIFSKEKDTQKVSKRDYLFGINENDLYNPNQQPLDSEPEIVVFNKIYDFAEDNDTIKLWAKNQTTSNIFGEYLDETLNVKKSFFDFIIKFKNGFYLYLEVKSKDDINPEKTDYLKTAYADYFNNRADDLFHPKLAIAVCNVDAKNHNIRFSDSIFYDNSIIKDKIEQFSFDELLEFFSRIEI